jgi:hypothetical protein
VNDYRDVLADYRSHPEYKSLGPDGHPCDRAKVGLLGRRTVHALPPTYIGKETNQREEATSGLVHDLDEVLNQYGDPEQDTFSTLVVPVLREMPVADVARAAKRSPRSIKADRAGDAMPRPATREALVKIAASYARDRLVALGVEPARNDPSVIAAYLDPSRRSP